MSENIFPSEERKWVEFPVKSEIQAGSNDIQRFSFIFSKSRKNQLHNINIFNLH